MDASAYGQLPSAATYYPQQTQGHVLCCLCGVPILPNPTNMCASCIRTQMDITEGIQKQVNILWCKMCGRYLQPPKHWLLAQPESKELLTYCIKRVKGLQKVGKNYFGLCFAPYSILQKKVKLVDAGFIWTEPHSMRLKVKLTVQGEVLNGAILQQSFVVEFVVERHMCPQCNRANANPNSWVACVQVRQHVAHKRTFFYLEQLILKHGADAHCVNIRDIHEGIDFFFASRAHAVKFVDFLQSVVPIRYRHDKQLVSHDIHTSTYNYKYTFSVEIVPICKDDLVCLPAPVARALGNLGPVVVCTRVTNALTLTDPLTLRSAAVEAAAYWRQPYRALMGSRQLTEFIVLDAEPLGPGGPGGYNHDGRLCLAECQVARASDFGANDRTQFARTHLGHVLHVGDVAMGYDVANANLADAELDKLLAAGKGGGLPDVVLVRKSYEEKRRRRRARAQQRPWKLKRMAVEAGEEEVAARGARGGQADQEQRDLERFMEELEEDAEMRARVALYKDPRAAAEAAAAGARAGSEMGESDEDDVPEVPLEELLDDLAAMTLGEEEEEEGGEGRGPADAGDHMAE